MHTLPLLRLPLTISLTPFGGNLDIPTGVEDLSCLGHFRLLLESTLNANTTGVKS